MTTMKNTFSEPTLLFEGRNMDFYLQESPRENQIILKDKDGSLFDTFCFSPVPLYRHPYISFENLDRSWNRSGEILPDGWDMQADDIVRLVAEGRKPLGETLWAGKGKRPSEKDVKRRFSLEGRDDLCICWRPDYVINRDLKTKEQVLFIARKGTLGDIYNVDEIIDAYALAGADIDGYRDIMKAWFRSVPIISFFCDPYLPTYSYLTWTDEAADIEFLIRGLAFGYPIETTMDLMREAYENKQGR